jgi:thioredoxin 1
MNMKKIDKKLLVKILVPILIVVTLTIIWIVKTHPTPTPIGKQTGNVADFVLETTSIDLDILKEYNMPIVIDCTKNTKRGNAGQSYH